MGLDVVAFFDVGDEGEGADDGFGAVVGVGWVRCGCCEDGCEECQDVEEKHGYC